MRGEANPPEDPVTRAAGPGELSGVEVRGLPVDPDIDLRVPRQRRELPDAPWLVLVAISAGGGVGAVSRYGVDLLLPHDPGQLAASTLLVNVSGCLLMGALMLLVSLVFPGTRLVRPFLGVGVLGGYTTYSTHIVDAQHMLTGGAPGLALLYLGGTLLGGLAAVWLGMTLAELAFRRRIARRGGYLPEADRR